MFKINILWGVTHWRFKQVLDQLTFHSKHDLIERYRLEWNIKDSAKLFSRALQIHWDEAWMPGPESEWLLLSHRVLFQLTHRHPSFSTAAPLEKNVQWALSWDSDVACLAKWQPFCWRYLVGLLLLPLHGKMWRDCVFPSTRTYYLTFLALSSTSDTKIRDFQLSLLISLCLFEVLQKNNT